MTPRGEPAGHGVPAGRPRSAATLITRAAAAAAAGALLLSGCSSPPEPTGPTPSPTSHITAPGTPTEPATPTPPAEPIEFAYQVAEPPCPPVSAIESLPLADEFPYTQDSPLVTERDDRILHQCSIEREDIDDDRDELFLEDRVFVGGTINLYPDAVDTRWPDAERELPVDSTDLDDWAAFAYSDSPFVWQEGCGPDTTCADDEEPTIQVHTMTTYLDGTVGNLEFRIAASYRAETLPADVERRSIAILREYVLAMIDGRERVD